MGKNDIIILILVGIASVALIIFLVLKNQRDKKQLNPDAPDAVEETHTDQERRADKI